MEQSRLRPLRLYCAPYFGARARMPVALARAEVGDHAARVHHDVRVSAMAFERSHNRLRLPALSPQPKDSEYRSTALVEILLRLTDSVGCRARVRHHNTVLRACADTPR